ncbi:hypothetical protein FEM48_ZijujUnG0091000 [Ziziphus jujuba var. spinosa]|uniref:Uncharacterized protein n=1 Tax=Ziziphus jujuba var. spinosa TaxID=714518 RepID=A0A978U8I1_ZIZJJ|nr:hypothetical protein FEM48_ZijujUnG0091000 [Ziziphus jujuba var. spinosa]
MTVWTLCLRGAAGAVWFTHQHQSSTAKLQQQVSIEENSTVYCVEPLKKFSSAWSSTKNWFVRIQDADSGKVHLTDPLSRITIKKLEMAKVDDWRELSHYEDIAFHNGRFYAMDFLGLTIAVDPHL